MINNGLKGCDSSTFSCLMQDSGLSIYQIANLTNYHPVTVWRSIHRLKRCGVLAIQNHGRGRRNSYEVKEDDHRGVVGELS